MNYSLLDAITTLNKSETLCSVAAFANPGVPAFELGVDSVECVGPLYDSPEAVLEGSSTLEEVQTTSSPELLESRSIDRLRRG